MTWFQELLGGLIGGLTAVFFGFAIKKHAGGDPEDLFAKVGQVSKDITSRTVEAAERLKSVPVESKEEATEAA